MNHIDRSNDVKVEIIRLGLSDISAKVLAEMEHVFLQSYHNGHMYEDFLTDITAKPNIFQVFLAKQETKLIGIAVIESKRHPLIEYYDYLPVHLKRFTVLPELRGKGVGRQLLDESKSFAFTETGVEVIFGESNEAGALSFYGREGALYSVNIIKTYSKRNAPSENLLFFREFITNPKFKTYRFPEGNGIQFVFCNTDDAVKKFQGLGYISKASLLKD